jgi:hypothetical protein
MGCDITSFVEKKNRDTQKWEVINDCIKVVGYMKEFQGKDLISSPFDWRSYDMYAFLAGVRNGSCITPIVEPRGIPDNASEEIVSLYNIDPENFHSSSYLTVEELLAFDYDRSISDIEEYLEEGDEEDPKTIREFLGTFFFDDLESLKSIGKPSMVRVIFWFN